jgi:cell division protein ZapD
MLRMNKDANIVPKMQLGHHGFSLRLSDEKSMREIYHTDATLELSICQL